VTPLQTYLNERINTNAMLRSKTVRNRFGGDGVAADFVSAYFVCPSLRVTVRAGAKCWQAPATSSWQYER
jgi:hypothetical protein